MIGRSPNGQLDEAITFVGTRLSRPQRHRATRAMTLIYPPHTGYHQVRGLDLVAGPDAAAGRAELPVNANRSAAAIACFLDFSRPAWYGNRMTRNETTYFIDWTRLFAEHRGQWVALADDEVTVLAAASTARGALDASVAKGATNPILYRVPDDLDTLVGHEVFL